jgi:diadenosine tetraphosphatase ApaH/serine/threonine PP2A family protein phosphatase
VLPGPKPLETMKRLLTLDIPVRFIHGNGDRVVHAYLKGDAIDEVPPPYRETISWTAEHLDAECRRAIAAWPATCAMRIDALGDVLFCHATPRNDVDCFTRVTPEHLVARLFAGASASIVVCGHTHMQFDRHVGELRIVNAGSIGAPFAPPRGAHWLLLGPDVQLQQTPYDFDNAAEQLRRTGFPSVEQTVVRYVLNPPPEADTLAMFAPGDSRT